AFQSQQGRDDHRGDHPRARHRRATAPPGVHPGRPGGRRPNGVAVMSRGEPLRAASLRAVRLSPRDVLRVGGHGLRARPTRVILSALGIAIGIAAMVAVVGISTSSRAKLDRLLDALGTNLLTAGPGSKIFGGEAKLPPDAVAMVERIRSVQSVSAIGSVTDAKA